MTVLNASASECFGYFRNSSIPLSRTYSVALCYSSSLLLFTSHASSAPPARSPGKCTSKNGKMGKKGRGIPSCFVCVCVCWRGGGGGRLLTPGDGPNVTQTKGTPDVFILLGGRLFATLPVTYDTLHSSTGCSSTRVRWAQQFLCMHGQCCFSVI